MTPEFKELNDIPAAEIDEMLEKHLDRKQAEINAILEDARREKADQMLGEYDFQDYVFHLSSGWAFTSHENEWSRPIFVTHKDEEDQPIEEQLEGAVQMGAFVVRFAEDSEEVEEAYATLNGHEIGEPIFPSAAAPGRGM